MTNRRQFLTSSIAFGGALMCSSGRIFSAQVGDIFEKRELTFLKNMLKTPSPSGYEQQVQKLWEEYTGKFADVSTDYLGNKIGVININGKPRLMLSGHNDEIGFLVTYIDSDGFIYFDTIGGFDQSIIPGRRVMIHTSHGKVPGVIGKPPIHMMTSDDRNRPSKVKDLFIDIGAKDDEKAKEVVTIGDPVTYTYEFIELRDGIAVARGFDDRVGSFIVAEVLKKVKAAKGLKASVHGVASVQEEVGLRGATASAFGIDPDIGIAIDVTHATDYPGISKKQAGDIKLGGGGSIARGPYLNPRVFDLLVEVAEKNDIPYQIEGTPRSTGTDANAIQITRAGVATGLVSIPLRYMHTPVETLDLMDVKHIIDLLAAFTESLEPDMDLRP